MTQAVVLDVGGTFVKYGVVTDGAIGETGQFPIRENGTAEEILSPILAFLTAHPAPRVAVSIPGPMDYPRGMSLMKHKFAAIYGVSLADWLGERLPGTEIVFVHDGVAFALGEMADGALALIAALVILAAVLTLELRQRSPLDDKMKKST